MQIELVSYNIHGCVGSDGHKDPERVVAVLEEAGGDIVALQEVPALDKGGEAFLSMLSARTGLTAIAGSELLAHFAHYGNALLTRFRPTKRSTLYLGVGTREPRGAIDVELDCGPVTLNVIATHLGLSPAERRIQIQRILPVVTRQPCPVALLGDINEWFTWGRPLRWLHAHFGKPPAPRSFPSVLPAFRLDRVWVSRPSVLMSVHAHRSPLARVASDHLPVKACAELRWADYTEASDVATRKCEPRRRNAGRAAASSTTLGWVCGNANTRGEAAAAMSHISAARAVTQMSGRELWLSSRGDVFATDFEEYLGSDRTIAQP